MRLEEIEQRLSAIKGEIDIEGADLDALETEISALKEERKGIKDKAEKRKALLDGVANLENPTIIKTFEEEKEKRTMELNKDNVLGSVEYRSAYLKGLQGKELNEVEQRAMTTAANSVGASIPTQTLNKIVEKVEQTSVLYNKITVLNIAGNVTLPVEGTTADASWVTETAASTDSDDTLGFVSLAAYKLIKTIEITANVEAMSIDAFETFIVNALYKKIAKAVEVAILNGSGVNQATGISKITYDETNSVTAIATGVTYTDIVKFIAMLKSGYRQNAIIVMNRNMLYNGVGNIVDTAKRPIFIQDTENGFDGSLLGYPVVVNDYVADNDAYFGDFSQYYFNWAKPIAIDNDKSVGFRSGSIVYRAFALADGKPALDEAFVKLTKAAA